MLRNSYKFVSQLRPIYLTPIQKLSSTTNTDKTDSINPANDGKKDISKAMKAYLERAADHNAFMKQQNYEFQIGKRHLANMMGEDPAHFTQDDVDEAIRYLFPSGLFEKKARPMMKPPEEIFPQRKAAEFDETGRPYHFLFYTGRPNFYKLLYDIVENINQTYNFEDAMIRKNNVPDPNLAIDTTGYQWLDKSALEAKLVETISDKEYDNFVTAIERLVSLPYSYKCIDFVKNYQKTLLSQTTSMEIPQLKYDEHGRGYITVYECLRKRARGHVTIRSPGSGIITVNNQDLQYFHDLQSREQIMFGLKTQSLKFQQFFCTFALSFSKCETATAQAQKSL